MRFHITVLALALGAKMTFAQSGLVAGPFVPGSGTYTTVPGGTFEAADPLTGWGDHLNVATITTATSPAMRGDQVGFLTGWSIGYYATNRHFQNAFVRGQTYVLSGFFRGEDLGGSLAIDVGNYGGRAWYALSQTAVQMDQATTGKWFFGYTTFVADNESLTVRLVRNGPTAEYADSYFDDVAVTPLSEFQAPAPVPEPATAAALGLGALALMRQRRRAP